MICEAAIQLVAAPCPTSRLCSRDSPRCHRFIAFCRNEDRVRRAEFARSCHGSSLSTRRVICLSRHLWPTLQVTLPSPDLRALQSHLGIHRHRISGRRSESVLHARTAGNVQRFRRCKICLLTRAHLIDRRKKVRCSGGRPSCTFCERLSQECRYVLHDGDMRDELTEDGDSYTKQEVGFSCM